MVKGNFKIERLYGRQAIFNLNSPPGAATSNR